MGQCHHPILHSSNMGLLLLRALQKLPRTAALRRPAQACARSTKGTGAAHLALASALCASGKAGAPAADLAHPVWAKAALRQKAHHARGAR